jgi:hypothetical protein
MLAQAWPDAAHAEADARATGVTEPPAGGGASRR